MILYLLAPVLILGAVEPQTSTPGTDGQNLTFSVSTGAVEPQTSTPGTDGQNLTFSVFTVENGTLTPSLYEVERRLEEQLKNKRPSVVTEDEESFQEEQDTQPHQTCLHNMTAFSRILCVEPFHVTMQEVGAAKWCAMDAIIRPYNDMTVCMDTVSHALGCFYPNQASQDLFLGVHASYFQNCTKEEVLLQDAPQWLVVTLTLVPVSLIPVLTYLVVWKSKIQE